MLLLINLKPPSSIFMIWLYALIFGLAVGTWLPAMSMTVSSTFGLTSYGVIFGAISFLFMIGGALGPVIAGLIYDVNQSYLWAYIMSFMLYGFTLPAILLVQRVQTED
jgi:MFS family permease